MAFCTESHHQEVLCFAQILFDSLQIGHGSLISCVGGCKCCFLGSIHHSPSWTSTRMHVRWDELLNFLLNGKIIALGYMYLAQFSLAVKAPFWPTLFFTNNVLMLGSCSLMFMLKCCERKILFRDWKVVLNKLKPTGRNKLQYRHNPSIY